MATQQCATLVLSLTAFFLCPSWLASAILRFAFVLPFLVDLGMADNVPRTLESFGVQVEHGQPVHPLPSNVALGLFNSDQLLDVASHADGRVQVYQNMGNGLFDLVGEKRLAGEVGKMEWRKARRLSEGILDIHSWADLHIIFTDGRNEVISHEQIVASRHLLTYTPNVPMTPSLDFREVWRSPSQRQPSTYMAIADIDVDGHEEIAYCFFPQFGDSNRFVVYECVGNDSFVVEWDTLLLGGFGPLAATDLDRNGQKEWAIINNGVKFLESEGQGRYQLYSSNIQWSSQGYITKGFQTDIDHDGIPEVYVQQANPSPPPGQPATTIYIAEFLSKDQTTMSFNIGTAQYYGYTFDMAVGQIDGTGMDEIIPAGGSFGVNEPVPIEYLWFNGITWRTRLIHTGLQSGSTAPTFVNLDADSTLELFIGAVGPIGHGSCYALDYVVDTNWTVLWADSSLRNTPLSVNAGILAAQFVVAGANTVDRGSLDTLYTDLHVYYPSGVKLGIWKRDSASVQNFHFLDIDNDGRTNLLAPVITGLTQNAHLAVYEYYGTTDVAEDGNETVPAFELSQNYPNPFNASTQIHYELPKDGVVHLVVCDILGREVSTLVNEQKPAGRYDIDFNTTGLASGVYFFRMQVGDFTSIKKMVLMK
jgi:hypothetical protein